MAVEVRGPTLDGEGGMTGLPMPNRRVATVRRDRNLENGTPGS